MMNEIDVRKPQKEETQIAYGEKDIEHYLRNKNFLDKHNIIISTITINCNLNTDIYIRNFKKYNTMLKMKPGLKKKRKDGKKPRRDFKNQTTVLIKPKNEYPDNYINIKVFKNGALHLTGCKDMNDFMYVTGKLIKILKKGHDKEKNSLKHYDYIYSPDKIGIYNVTVQMINSNFRVDYKINRKKLFKLLLKFHNKETKDTEIGYVECKYGPNGGHSCVDIKYRYDEKNKPSIFVFQTGSILITGAKKLEHIIKSYQYIMKILDRYYQKIKIPELDKEKILLEIDKYMKKNYREYQ